MFCSCRFGLEGVDREFGLETSFLLGAGSLRRTTRGTLWYGSTRPAWPTIIQRKTTVASPSRITGDCSKYFYILLPVSTATSTQNGRRFRQGLGSRQTVSSGGGILQPLCSQPTWILVQRSRGHTSPRTIKSGASLEKMVLLWKETA